MQGLPIDINFDTFVGRRVTMVRIGTSFLHYILNNDVPNRPHAWIEIESNQIIFTDIEGKSTEITDFRTGAGSLCLLLGLTFEKLSRRNDGGLILNTSSGIRLEVAVHTPMYESIVIHIDDHSIVG